MYDRTEERVTSTYIRGHIFCKTVRETGYEPTHPSAEALICLNCKSDECKGECERLRTELKKLKER